MGLLMFPWIVRSLPPSKGHEKSVFISFGFLNRAMRLPDQEYRDIPFSMIKKAEAILSKEYELAFGPTANSYNYHNVSSHLLKIREEGLFTDYSAYAFGRSYGDLGRIYIPGTLKFDRNIKY